MIYFAGDFHLGVPDAAGSREREMRLCAWLEHVAVDATEIYLMGDVFDFWFEYERAVPKGFVRLLGTLARLTDRGIKITLFKGNHDMWMFGYLEQECGVHIISDGVYLERNGKKFYLHHGDGLGHGEKAYKVLRGFFRSKVCQNLFGFIHPNLGIGLALFLSRRSRISQKGRYEEYLGDKKELLTQFAKEMLEKEHIDYFVFGHRHLQLNIELGSGSRYFNAGEWVHGSAYLKFDGNEMALLNWENR